MTKLENIYKIFLLKITQDMYSSLETSKNETIELLQELVIISLPKFTMARFPKKVNIIEPKIKDYMTKKDGELYYYKEIEDDSYMLADLSITELDILTDIMVVNWIDQLNTSQDMILPSWNGTDAKQPSPANHLDKVKELSKYWQSKVDMALFNYSKTKTDRNGYEYSCFGDIIGGE